MKNIFFLLAFVSANAFATGGKVGSGGDALKVGNNLFVLDLLEAGVEGSPYFDDSVVVDQNILNLFAGSLNVLRDPNQAAINEKIARKLSELAVHDRMFAAAIAVVIKRFNWTLVNIPLDDVQDEDSLLKYEQKDLVQVAVRRDNFIKISRKDWNILDLNNRAAIILHEALYALIKPREIPCEKASDGTQICVTKQVQISSKAREVNGFLFSKHLDDENFDRLATLASDDFPVGFGCPSGKFKMRVYVGTYKYESGSHFSYNHLSCAPFINLSGTADGINQQRDNATESERLPTHKVSFEADHADIQKAVSEAADELEKHIKKYKGYDATIYGRINYFSNLGYKLDLSNRVNVNTELNFLELKNNKGFFYYAFRQDQKLITDFQRPTQISPDKLQYEITLLNYDRVKFIAALEERIKLLRDFGFKGFDF